MSEPLERWNEDAPERFRAAKAGYAQLGPDGEQLERMLARIEQASATSGASAPPGLGLGSKAWRWLLPVVSVLGAAWLWTSRPVPAPSVPASAAVERAAPAPTPAAVTPHNPAAGGAIMPEAAAAPAAVPPATAQRARATRSADPLAELVLLDRARRVMAKDPARALALAGQHARDYAAGQFAEERELLAIEALAQLGRREAAERRAQAFRRTHPRSVHEHRLGVILEYAGALILGKIAGREHSPAEVSKAMDNVLPRTLLAIALGGLAASCSGGLFVGEKNCVGEGIDCDSDAPTLEIIDMLIDNPVLGSDFEVAASRMVAPSWVYDDPRSRWAQLAPAPGGGVWVLYGDSPSELQRINAEGTPVESHSVDASGTSDKLSSDEALRPVVLSSRGGWATRTTLDPRGEVFAWSIGAVAPEQSWPFLVDGPEGRTRVAVFDERGSHVAEHTGTGDLVWKQPQVRDARHFPFGPDRPSLAYRMLALSDGSIALGVPKDARSDRRPGLSRTEQLQGITLIEPDGNLRWDMVLDEASVTMFLAPGLDGSVVYANTLRDGSNSLNITGVMYVRLIDRDGKLAASWSGQRTGYHEAVPSALCTDAVGQIYVAAFSGERDDPVPTVCRMNPDDPGDVVCLGVADVLRPTNAELLRRSGLSSPFITAISAPEPDAVVLAISQSGYERTFETGVESAEPVSRLVRIDF